jgi:type III secretion protein T
VIQPAIDQLTTQLYGVALTLPRIVAAFLMLPLMTAQTVPPLVRNSFFVSLAIIAYPIAAAAAPLTQLNGVQWPFIIIKELFIGLVLGFSFGSVFWAVGAAGNLVDAKVGSNLSGLLDPIQGHQTSLTGALLSQLAAWLFMASGAFTIFLNLLLTSYRVWPVAQFLPQLAASGQTFFIERFSDLMTLALLLSAPALVVT